MKIKFESWKMLKVKKNWKEKSFHIWNENKKTL